MKSKPRKPRKKRSIRIKVGLLQWVEERMKKGEFKNFSHAVEIALERLRGLEKE